MSHQVGGKGRAAEPDPNRDTHLAFPDDPAPPTRTLPPSAFAPPPGSSPVAHPPATYSATDPRLEHRPPVAARPRGPRKRFIVLALIGAFLISGRASGEDSGHSESAAVAGPGGARPCVSSIDCPSADPRIAEIDETDAIALAPLSQPILLPEDAVVTAIGGGRDSLRVVVVSTGASSEVEIDTDRGRLVDDPVTKLPYVAEVSLLGNARRLEIELDTPEERNGQPVTVQCQVWSGTMLVALDTGQGSAECRVDLDG